MFFVSFDKPKAAFIERIKSDLDILLSTTATATSVVGKYPITIDYTEHDNYDVTLNEVDLTTATKCNAVYTIANATMIYQVTAEDGIYDKKGHSINIAVTTPPTGTVIYYSTNADLASGKKDDPSAVEGASNEKPAFTAAGVHTVYYYITAPNYEDVYGWKTVTIQKAEQTITAEDSQFITYDGKTHVPYAVADGGGTLSYSCKDAAGKAVSEMIDAGTYTVTIHAAETENYNTATSITRTFTIKAAGLTIQASSKTAEYAEDARLTCQEYTMKSGSLADGDTITDVIMRSYQQNVGACDNIIEGVVIRSERRENVDVTKNYSITYEKGTLTVTQATPVIEFTTTSVDMNKTYNKVPVEDPVFTKTGDGTASIQYYRIEKSDETESRTLLTTRPVNAGDYEAEVTTTATHNYKVGTSTPLRFKIEPQPVKITGQPQKSKYGETIKEVTAKLTGGTVYEGDNLYVSAATTATRTSAVGTYAVIPGYKADPNYKVTTENGVYTIENAAIQYEITGTDVTFDTTAHKIKIETTEPVKADIYYSETSFAGVREEDLTEEQKKVPEHTNAGEYTIYYYIKAPNYESVISSVSMKIGKAKQDISVEEASCTYSYDGKPHMIEASASDGGEISYRVEGVASSDHIIDAGTYHVTVTANATSNYAIATKKVDMTINRLPITITADSKEREYDRTDLTKNSYRMTSGSLADGDSIEAVVVTGSQNEVGSSPNIAKDALIRSSKRPTGESDVTKNYTISYVPGTLKVTKAEPAVQITSTPDQLGKTYNKTNIITPIVTSTGDSTPVIYYYKVEGENETRLADGEIPVNAGIYKVKAYAKETKNFKESYSDAVTFEITPEEIELRAHDATSIYGKEIEVLETSITKGKIYSGDSLGIKAVTDAEKGSNAGTYDIIPTYTVNPNYDVKVFKGTYTITKAEMVCSIEGETVDYDGSGHSIQIEMTAPSVVNAEIYYSTKEELTEDNYRDKDIATTIRPHFTSVGSHVVYYYIVAPNYLAKAGHETVKIRKAG